MCETREMGGDVAHWHTLISKGKIRVEMRYVCPMMFG